MSSPGPSVPGATEFLTAAIPAAEIGPRPPTTPERQRAKEALKALLMLTASGSGEEFFRAVVRRLAELLAVQQVRVGVVDDLQPGYLRVLATWGGDQGDDFLQPLPGSLAEQVLARGLCQLSSQARTAFPEDEWLRESGCEAAVGVPIHAANGTPIGMLALLHSGPVTLAPVQHDMLGVVALRLGNELERLRAERALRESDERFHELANHTEDIVWMLELVPAARLSYLSPAFEQVYGRSRGPYLADARLAYQLIHPADLPGVRVAFSAAVRARETRVSAEFRIVRPDGSVRWLADKAAIKQASDGRPCRISGVSRDITEWRAAQAGLEERNAMLRAISEVQARFIGEAGPEETFARMVEKLVRLTGSGFGLVAEVEPAPTGESTLVVKAYIEQTDGAPPGFGFVQPAAAGRHCDQLTRLLEAAVASGEARISQCPPSEACGCQPCLGLPLKSAGRVVGAVAVGRLDGFTSAQAAFLEPFLATCAGLIAAMRQQRQREAAEAHVRQLNAELEQRVCERTAELAAMNEELSQFAYVVTHDLKAPLRGISQLSEWISRDHAAELSDEAQRYFGLLGQRVQHLHRLVDGLLACARVGRAPEPESQVDTRQLVQEVLGHLAPPPRVVVELAPDLPVVTGNSQRLHQVFQNLLDNALKYLDKPRGLIRIQAERQDGEWEFSVADNGPGIPPRFHEKAFQIFQRLTVDASLPGTGLGLTLVKRILENRGGRIWIEATEGGGTTMRFRWPDEPGRPATRPPWVATAHRAENRSPAAL